MKKQSPDHLKLYKMAENQGGYFTSKQAQEAGLSKDLLSHLVSSGKFLRLRQGVYRIKAFPEMPYSEYFEIWVSTAMKSVFSHQSALNLYELTDRIVTAFHLTVPRKASQRLENVYYHTSKLKTEEITTRHGLPVTDIPRTLYDLYRSRESPEWIIQAAQQALERGMISEGRLMERIQTYSQAFQRFMKEVLEKRETS